jgi:8-oxo-dGTP pyrophosphatase MutT (NUDIX family)
MGNRTDVVTAFLVHGNQILLLQRSDDVKTYQGHWAGVSGYLEADEPIEQARVEIREETGISPEQIELIKEGDPLEFDDGEHPWRVHPFCFQIESPVTPNLDREHMDYMWTDPDTITELETVPKLKEAWEAVQ